MKKKEGKTNKTLFIFKLTLIWSPEGLSFKATSLVYLVVYISNVARDTL